MPQLEPQRLFSQQNLATALGLDPRINLAAIIQEQGFMSEQVSPNKPHTGMIHEPMQLYRQIGEPNRPIINRAFSSQSITSPKNNRGPLRQQYSLTPLPHPVPPAPVAPANFEPKKEIIESVVQPIATQGEGWKKQDESMMGQLKGLISDKGSEVPISKEHSDPPSETKTIGLRAPTNTLS